MSQIKWAKLDVNLFQHDKIIQILALPNGEEMVLIWIRLILLAGKINQGGGLYLTENFPYSQKNLSVFFQKSEKKIKYFLEIFKKFQMISIENDVIFLTNWGKYQDTDKLEKLREQNKNRQKSYRENKRMSRDNDVTDNVTEALRITHSNAIERARANRDKIESKNKIYKKPTTPYSRSSQKSVVTERSSSAAATTKNDFIELGNLGNVRLTEKEHANLKKNYPDKYENLIGLLDRYLESNPEYKKDHYRALYGWVYKALEEHEAKLRNSSDVASTSRALPNGKPTSEKRQAPTPDWFHKYYEDFKNRNE